MMDSILRWIVIGAAIALVCWGAWVMLGVARSIA